MLPEPIVHHAGPRRMEGHDQLGLFEQQRLILAEDGEGGIVYCPGLIDREVAAAWFDELRTEVAWRSERRMMYDREVDVPRLVAHYRLDPPGPAPAAIIQAARAAHEALGVDFNAVGLNFYRDERDSVAPHNDHLNELVPGYPIALVSLGSARRMIIREKDPPRRAMHVDLEPGSLLTMSHASQLKYLHGIPKQKLPCAPRISLAFRMRTPHALDDY